MERLDNGIINISDDLNIYPGYLFEQFKKTKFYNNQDGIMLIYLDDLCVINKNKYRVSLFFRDNKIYIVSLYYYDNQINESERKNIHDKILAELGIYEKKIYSWGKIYSVYDRRGNVSSINIEYLY